MESGREKCCFSNLMGPSDKVFETVEVCGHGQRTVHVHSMHTVFVCLYIMLEIEHSIKRSRHGPYQCTTYSYL